MYQYFPKIYHSYFRAVGRDRPVSPVLDSGAVLPALHHSFSLVAGGVPCTLSTFSPGVMPRV